MPDAFADAASAFADCFSTSMFSISLMRSMLAVAWIICGIMLSRLTTGDCIWLTNWRKAVMTPKVISPSLS